MKIISNICNNSGKSLFVLAFPSLNKYDALYKVLNECNDRYIYVKFVLDEENGQINARCDNIIQLDTCGENCYELMVRMLKIVEDAYPSFMKALWT